VIAAWTGAKVFDCPLDFEDKDDFPSSPPSA
jgi:hypothetical protein